MKINSVQSYKTPAFKGIVTKDFIVAVKNEAEAMCRQGRFTAFRKLSDLYTKVDSLSKEFDIEIIAPKLEPRDKVKKIVPNKTVVFLDNVRYGQTTVVYTANKKAGEALNGKVIHKKEVPSAEIPHKEILADDDWATGVGYITVPYDKVKYKNTTEILSQVLSNLTSAKAKLNRMKKKIDDVSMFSKTANSFIDKLSVDINKLN